MACVRLIFGKVGVDRFTRPQQKIDVRYKFDFKVVLNIVQTDINYCSHFWLNFQAERKLGIVSVRLRLPKVEVDRFNDPR